MLIRRFDLRLSVIEIEADIPVVELHKGLNIRPFLLSSGSSSYTREEVHLAGIHRLFVAW